MDKKISVIIPAFNEAENIALVIDKIKKCEDVKEIIVVNNLSTDNTGKIALNNGAKVIDCNQQGKGYAMEKGIQEAKGEIIVFLDADIASYSEDIVYKLTRPIIENDIDFVKASFERDGGRVTELVAKPLLKILFPELPRYSQPLGGMIAGKKEVFDKLELEKDYGVDIGILLDVTNMNYRIEEVMIGKIQNVSKEWKALEKMSTEVMIAIIKRSNV